MSILTNILLSVLSGFLFTPQEMKVPICEKIQHELSFEQSPVTVKKLMDSTAKPCDDKINFNKKVPEMPGLFH